MRHSNMRLYYDHCQLENKQQKMHYLPNHDSLQNHQIQRKASMQVLNQRVEKMNWLVESLHEHLILVKTIYHDYQLKDHVRNEINDHSRKDSARYRTCDHLGQRYQVIQVKLVHQYLRVQFRSEHF